MQGIAYVLQQYFKNLVLNYVLNENIRINFRKNQKERYWQ